MWYDTAKDHYGEEYLPLWDREEEIDIKEASLSSLQSHLP